MPFVSRRRATTLTRRMIARAALPSPLAASLMALSLGAIAFLTACNTRSFNVENDSEGQSRKANEANGAMSAVSAPRASNIPLDEVSGLTGWPGSGASPERIVAVSDARHVVAIGDLSASGAPAFEKKDLAPVMAAFGDKPGKASQFEAVTSDAEGRVYVMSEKDASVHVFSPDLSSVLARVNLTVPKGHPLAKEWESDDNSRAEGLVLLGANHFLVVKEKDPAVLMEFGPAGDAPVGFTAETKRKVSDGGFRLPDAKRSEFVPLKVWPLAKSAAEVLPDVSEATVGEDGFLYLLGDQARVIARVEADLRPDEGKARVEAWWPLPKAASKPEGLAFLPGLRPAVAIDTDDAAAENLFVFAAIR